MPLTLRQFEDVLLAINDAQGAAGRQLTNIACVKPAIVLEHLSCLLLILDKSQP